MSEHHKPKCNIDLDALTYTIFLQDFQQIIQMVDYRFPIAILIGYQTSLCSSWCLEYINVDTEMSIRRNKKYCQNRGQVQN